MFPYNVRIIVINKCINRDYENDFGRHFTRIIIIVVLNY